MVKTYGENLWWKLNPSAEEWHDCHSKNIFLSTKYFQTSTFKNWNKIIFHQVHDKNSDIKSVLFQSLLKWSFIACLLLKLTVTQHFFERIQSRWTSFQWKMAWPNLAECWPVGRKKASFTGPHSSWWTQWNAMLKMSTSSTRKLSTLSSVWQRELSAGFIFKFSVSLFFSEDLGCLLKPQYMSPLSPVFPTVATVNIDLKNILRVGTSIL